MSANNNQVGGDHYKTVSGVQHWDATTESMGPGYLIGCATKYLSRWRNKNGVEDLKKAQHYVAKLREGLADGEYSLPIQDLTIWAKFCNESVSEPFDQYMIMDVVQAVTPSDLLRIEQFLDARIEDGPMTEMAFNVADDELRLHTWKDWIR